MATSLRPLLSVAPLLVIPIFWRLSPASKSTKLWTTIYVSIAAIYIAFSDVVKPALAAVTHYISEQPLVAARIAVFVGASVKYIQRKLHFARLNAIKWKYGFESADPKTWQDMTIEQANVIEQNICRIGVPSPVSIRLAV